MSHPLRPCCAHVKPASRSKLPASIQRGYACVQAFYSPEARTARMVAVDSSRREEVTGIRLEDFVTGWNETAEAHRNSDPRRWALCDQFARLHTDAAAVIARQAGPYPSRSDKAVLLLTVHAMNVYGTLVGLVARGQFDVALYLYRGLADAGALAYGCGLHPDLGAHWDSGHLKASTARRRAVADLRKDGESELADAIEDRFLRDATAMNELAHVKRLHGGKLIHRKPDGIEPTLGGHRDDRQYADTMLAVLDQEYWCLTFIGAARKGWLTDDWTRRYVRARAAYVDLLQEFLRH